MGSTTTTSTLTTITLHTQPTKTPTNNMSAPNVDAPNEGIVGQVTNSVKNAANYVSETNQEQAKGNVGDTTMSGRASGALGAASDKLDQTKHESAGKASKEAI